MRAFTLIRDTFFSKTPVYVLFYVTSLCNARCQMCYNWRRVWNAKPGRELAVDEIRRIFSSFSRIQQLTLTGGEPFMRHDLRKIIEGVSENGKCPAITIATNGILTESVYSQTSSILEALPENVELKVFFSVHHIGKEHDRIVGVKGAFERLLTTYKMLSPLRDSHRNFHMGINIHCTALNRDMMKELLTFSNDTFEGCTVHLGMVRGPTPTSGCEDVSLEDFRRAVGHFRRIRGIQKDTMPLARMANCVSRLSQDYALKAMETGRQPIRCRAAQSLIAIQSDGEVYPCDALEKSLGNLRDYDYDIRLLSHQPRYREIVGSIKKGECHCTSECGLKWSIPFSVKANVRLAWEILSSVRDTPIV